MCGSAKKKNRGLIQSFISEFQLLRKTPLIFDYFVLRLQLLKDDFHRVLCGAGFIGDVPIMLAKPQTFMNLSGESVSKLS